jgi:hypothetical protein
VLYQLIYPNKVMWFQDGLFALILFIYILCNIPGFYIFDSGYKLGNQETGGMISVGLDNWKFETRLAE